MRLNLDQKLNKFSAILLVIFSLIWANSFSHAADDAGQYLVLGLGNLSCKSFLYEDEEGAAYYLSWLAGYITAYNQLSENTYSVLGKAKTIGQIESWLFDYCTINNDETFENAIRNLLRNLKYSRIKQE